MSGAQPRVRFALSASNYDAARSNGIPAGMKATSFQYAVGTANVRASCIALLATGNVGGFGSGANIFRGHCNVQGATDLGLDVVTLPLYYGLAEGA